MRFHEPAVAMMQGEGEMQSAPAIPIPFSVNSEGGSLLCENVDLALVRQLSRSLLLALASACVEKTYGDPFKSSISVASSVKTEMVSFLAAQPPPMEEIAALDMAEDLLDQFVQRNVSFFGRFSSKLTSDEAKEERIEDLAEEMDLAQTWIASDRDKLAVMLIKNLDVKGVSVCRLRFDTEMELGNHKSMCPFRPVTCGNEHCSHVFSALHVLEHDTICPFKLLPCEQHCESVLRRSEMDKHCVTVCPMRSAKCPFFHVGCTDMLPWRTLEQHCQESMGPHLMCTLQVIQKQEMLLSSLMQRVLLLEKALAINERSEAVDVGTLTLSVRHQDAKIRALEQEGNRLRQDLKKSHSLAEVIQLRSELESLRSKVL